MISPYRCTATKWFDETCEFKWKTHNVILVETPGHSEGSICILIDKQYLFSGDSLLEQEIAVADDLFKKAIRKRIENVLKSTSRNCYVYPGHGENFSLEQFLKLLNV